MAPAGLIEEITQHLQEAGLSVDAPFGPYRGWAEMLVYREMEQDPTGILLASEMGIISFATNHWHFRVWKSIPGPGPMDFEHEVTSAGELVALVRQFFLGEPLTIEGWVVPMHRHPEWNESHLRLAIAQAQPLPFSTWKHPRDVQRDAHLAKLPSQADSIFELFTGEDLKRLSFMEACERRKICSSHFFDELKLVAHPWALRESHHVTRQSLQSGLSRGL